MRRESIPKDLRIEKVFLFIPVMRRERFANILGSTGLQFLFIPVMRRESREEKRYR